MRQPFRIKPLTLCVLQALSWHAYAAETPEAPQAPAPVATAADTAAPATPDTSATAIPTQQIDTIFVHGESRQVQNITRTDLAQALPGTSPLKTLEKLPGVSFQSADPFGAYEWSTHISIRGFGQNQLGFTLDDIPLGDMSYRNNNGLHISRAVSSENIGGVTVSQGAGSLGTASTSNLGGTVAFATRGPADDAGATVAQTFGSDNTSRTFARYDTGLFGTGTKAYFSVTRQHADKWKGDGAQDQQQFNSKVVQTFGQSRISAFFNYSRRDETDYQDMSFDMVRRLGYKWDNYAPDWQRAVNAANGIYTGGVTNVDDAYYLGRGLRNDALMGVALDWRINDDARLKTTAYHHGDEGQSQWYTPYTPSSAAVPISVRGQNYSIQRNGIVADLAWELGSHTLAAGFWAERSISNFSRDFYAISGPQDTDTILHGPTSTAFEQDFVTNTTQFYAQDTLSLLDERLKLNFGFKTPRVTIDASNLVAGRAAGRLVASENFLPQAGISYALDQHNELFSSWAKNMRAFQPGADGPFSQTQAAFDLSAGNLRPETSTTVDLGIRSSYGDLKGSLAIYHADFDNRQLSIATCAGIVGCPTTLANVGKVSTSGLEAAVDWRLARNWSWFNSFTYNDSTYRSTPAYFDGGAAIDVNGKQAVDTPKILFNTELAYDSAGWFGRLGAKYTGTRYYTYLNDSPVPAFWVANLTAGYKLLPIGPLKSATLQFNVTNLFNKQYYSTVGTNGFVSSDPAGTFATLQEGAPRAFFVTLSAKL